MPDEQQLPPGPRRDLAIALHQLYALAGKPAARALSTWIRDRDDLPGTLSHEGVSAVLRGSGTPRWANLESLVRVLVEQQRVGAAADVDAVVTHIHSLWMIADGGPPSASESSLASPAIEGSGQHREATSGNHTSQPATAGPVLGDGQGSRMSPQGALIRWKHPRLGTLDFRDRQTTVEIFKEWGSNDQP